MAYLFGKEFTRNELMQRVGDISQLGGIKQFEIADGRAKGVAAFEVNTGAGLRFTVLPDRCMDIAWSDFKSTPISWISKTGVTAPQYFEHKGLEWLRGFFGGMLTTCGLRNAGSPSTYNGEEFGVHGRISNTPAENVCVTADWEGNDYVMKISGQMRESKVFGENLLFKREISTKLGENKLKIKDTIVNQGFKPEGVMLLYHMNFGFPLVDDGAKIVMPKGKLIPATDIAAKGIDTADKLHKPINGYEEQCFLIDFEQDGEIEVGIENVNIADCKGIYIKYDKSQLPWFTIWKMLGESEYVVGLEPGTCLPMGREKAENEGYLKILKPFEEYSVEIEFGIKI